MRKTLLLVIAAVCTPIALAQTADLPDWQKAAGGRLSFEVVSIRPSGDNNFTPPNFALSPDDSFYPTGGILTADFPVEVYIAFAYKLVFSPEQRKALPNWVKTERFTIEARGPVDATKDQMRLMMQSLLADRFAMQAHFETQTVPVFVMTLVHPGKTGPSLRPHNEGLACDKPLPTTGTETSPSVFPPVCGLISAIPAGKHALLFGSRNTTPDLLAEILLTPPSSENLGRPFVNHTGLTGRFDFTLNYLPGEVTVPEGEPLEAPSFLEAIRTQLGIKLATARLPIPVFVVDYIEPPSAN